MKTIYKYVLSESPLQSLQMPSGAEVLSVQAQNGRVCLWVRVDNDAPKEFRHFSIEVTGGALADVPSTFIGTVQLDEGRYVVHIFEVLP